MISLTVENSSPTISSKVENNRPKVGLEIKETVIGEGTTDYNKLKNKPKLNGQVIRGNMVEIDPTVPAWAKAEQKPAYNAKEVGAVDENDNISLEEIDNILNTIWGN